MKSNWEELHALNRALETLEDEDDFVSFESQSLIRELKKSVQRGDDEITVILARAFCKKYLRSKVPAQECVIYTRVSSEQQALKSGLLRQMKTCVDYARRKDYNIVGVFSEVASGVDDLPTRALVERIAKKRQCLILCEDHSRWSRKGVSEAPPAYVIMASTASQKLDENILALLEMHDEAIRAEPPKA